MASNSRIVDWEATALAPPTCHIDMSEYRLNKSIFPIVLN